MNRIRCTSYHCNAIRLMFNIGHQFIFRTNSYTFLSIDNRYALKFNRQLSIINHQSSIVNHQSAILISHFSISQSILISDQILINCLFATINNCSIHLIVWHHRKSICIQQEFLIFLSNCQS
jgi:hypothetical protein